jgi:hypothetical protein
MKLDTNQTAVVRFLIAVLIASAIISIMGCQKPDQPEPTYCFVCDSPMGRQFFDEYTETQMDSVIMWRMKHLQDTMICTKDTVLNLWIYRAYQDWQENYRGGFTQDSFEEWMDNDSGNDVYQEGSLFEENDTIIGTDTLQYWIKLD